MYIYVKSSIFPDSWSAGWYLVERFTEDGGAWVQAGKTLVHFTSYRLTFARSERVNEA